jgi:Reverse transcriptase (RNA-dependent DNA polymerase).
MWRYKLIEKLLTLGIKNNMLRCIAEFISQRFCATKYSNTISKYKQTHRGLPQGAVLSTTLFNIYLNDLFQTLETSGMKVAAFADDIAIWSSRKSTLNDQLKANTESTLITLQRWCSENLMTINTEKTTYQIFSLAKKPINLKI